MILKKEYEKIGQVFIYLTFFVSCFLIGKNQFQKSNLFAADDLVLRINGAALLHNHENVYTYKWTKGEPEKYFYYSQRPTQIINGITSTPFLLWTHTAFINLSYCDIKQVWIIIQLLCLYAAIFFLINSTQLFVKQFFILLGSILFFAISPNWLVHLESGQVYVIYALFFSIFYWFEKKGFRKKKLYQSILLSVAILLRPILIISFVYFFIKKDFEIIKTSVISFFIIFLFTLFLYPVSYWKDYNQAMKEYSKEVIDQISVPNTIIPNQEPDKNIACLYKPESRTFNAGALYTLQKYLSNIGIKASHIFLYIFSCFLGILILIFPIRKKIEFLSKEQSLVLLFLMYLIFELTTPTVRNPYNIIQWLAISLIIISNWKENLLSVILMLIGLMLNQHIFIEFTYSREIGEILMIVSAFLFIWIKPEFRLLNKLILFIKSNK